MLVLYGVSIMYFTLCCDLVKENGLNCFISMTFLSLSKKIRVIGKKTNKLWIAICLSSLNIKRSVFFFENIRPRICDHAVEQILSILILFRGWCDTLRRRSLVTPPCVGVIRSATLPVR